MPEITYPAVTVGQVLDDDTWVAATLVGVGGRFRGGAREYEVMRTPGATDAMPSYPENAIVREVDGSGYEYPIVQNLCHPRGLVVTRVGPGTPERHNLFIAVAMAGGCGGRIANNDGDVLRILGADDHEGGRVRLTSSVGDSDGAVLVAYSEHTDATWTVVAAAESTPTATEPVTAQAAPSIIPRTLDDATARIAALENLATWIPANDDNSHVHMLRDLRTIASWLDGGERQLAGHDLAANHPEGSLCGSYEGLVCETFGWSPRRSHGRWITQLQQWGSNVDAFERTNSHRGAADILRDYAQLYEAGGPLNNEVNQYVADHLEENKVRHIADLFGKIGWDAPEVPDEESEYEVRVPVTRTVTMSETGYAYVTVTARDEDDALQLVSDHHCSRELAREVDEWNIDYDSQDSDDYSAEADFYSAEIV